MSDYLMMGFMALLGTVMGACIAAFVQYRMHLELRREKRIERMRDVLEDLYGRYYALGEYVSQAVRSGNTSEEKLQAALKEATEIEKMVGIYFPSLMPKTKLWVRALGNLARAQATAVQNDEGARHSVEVKDAADELSNITKEIEEAIRTKVQDYVAI